MTTYELLNEIRRKLNTLNVEAPISLEQLQTDNECIAIQSVPVRAEYQYSGARAVPFQFNVLSKSLRQHNAVNRIDIITKELAQDKAIVLQEPSYIGKEGDCFVYVATFMKNIERGNQ